MKKMKVQFLQVLNLLPTQKYNNRCTEVQNNEERYGVLK